MSDPKLARLESEVEAARMKLAADLATLTSPATLSHFREAVITEAHATKARVVSDLQDGTRSRVQDFVDGLKAKAAANPVAVAAIGAGLAWRLMRHPPVTTALVGVGLYSLLNTDRREQPFVEKYGLDEKATALKEQVSEFGETASLVAGQAAEKLQDWGSKAKAVAGELVTEAQEKTGLAIGYMSEAKDEVRDSAQRMTTQASKVGQQAASVVQGAVSDDVSRDRMLLGMAGIAVATAVGIAFQRRGNGA
jgi:hypothetical protein